MHSNACLWVVSVNKQEGAFSSTVSSSWVNIRTSQEIELTLDTVEFFARFEMRVMAIDIIKPWGSF